ncbi:MAG: hypothetical protein F6K55_03050 [Moorea sp. SIO4A3]|nr:hypothetical protein [Moorena sp. SIO4A3]
MKIKTIKKLNDGRGLFVKGFTDYCGFILTTPGLTATGNRSMLPFFVKGSREDKEILAPQTITPIKGIASIFVDSDIIFSNVVVYPQMSPTFADDLPVESLVSSLINSLVRLDGFGNLYLMTENEILQKYKKCFRLP